MDVRARRKNAERMSDAEIAKLDRPGIWQYAWKVRGADDSPAGVCRARAVIMKWERLTGRRYHEIMS